ncbi:two-component sensor histidine kinase [Prauserella marina]|uniref:histidine kinase n=1 Tax=Prauserella marina TaxID=530584 RepID=A0A222VP95_9PSEU|nr:sensor histidine kinase [Prauserella marina]ASR35704.1 two-component sensor histidine kinase [Prauserella marina]PWV84418.1 histidine kinase/DNA gyrase B/HSP90-like ATPase [Prauserella marina]SDC23051.1 Histidine kinase-, DNA gyrase B-, and HSP90-like ATPase [Prauserella marina]
MITLRRVPELWRRFDGVVWYSTIGLLLFTGSLIPALHSHGTQVGGMPHRSYDVLAVLAIVLQCAPLAVCRRWPAVCLALVSVGFVIDQLRGYHTFAGTALAISLLNAGSRLEWRRRATAITLSVAYVPLVASFHLLGGGEPPGEFVLFYLACALVWGIGTWLRSTRAAEAERRRLVAEETRTAERDRIARELHDVVTHHVTAMVVQAEAARYVTASPERLDDTLSVITDTGRRAISDLRTLLDLLDPGHGTETKLSTLVERTRQAGQPVEFTEEGTPHGAGSAGPVAYRVVQEALTNALKYDHGSPTSVEVRHGEREITVEVSTDGSGARAGVPGGSGRGLAGLRERVDLLGGDFSAGSGASGGFRVRARIPERTTS